MYNITKIQNQFNKVVKYSQNLNGEVNSDSLFADWEQNKKEFITLWGGKLIKDLGPVTVHLTPEQRSEAINTFLEKIVTLAEESEVENFNVFDFSDFIQFFKESFFDNVLTKDYFYKGIKIPKGMKITRAFKFFCSDKDFLNDIQSVASLAIQNDKITGTLCMSVHPLDYLSISENQHNWRSCHALDGEYRAGNLNYMADSTTVVCYLRSKEETVLPRFSPDVKWNSKKWRVLLFFDNQRNTIMAGRQYPFAIDQLLLNIKKEVEKMYECKFSGWCDKYIDESKISPAIKDEKNDFDEYEIYHDGKYIPVGGQLILFNTFVQDRDGTLQFNDLLNSSSYINPYYSFRLKNNWLGTPSPIQEKTYSTPKMRVGKKCTCLECGKEDITMSEAFLCKHCMVKEGQVSDTDVFGFCFFCGESFVFEDGNYLYDQWGYSRECCPDCLKKSQECKGCGDMFYKNAINENGLCPCCQKEASESMEENTNQKKKWVKFISLNS